jgi:hypothetical protein
MADEEPDFMALVRKGNEEEDIDEAAIEAALEARLANGDMYSEFDDTASVYSNITVKTNAQKDPMSQTMQSFTGGTDFIAPDTDLDAYLENLLATKNKSYRAKLQIEQDRFVSETKRVQQDEMDMILDKNERFK